MEQQTFYYDNKIVKYFIYATLLWGVVGMIVGLLVAVQIAHPVLNFDFALTTFGRTRPLHTNAIIFAFVGNAIFAGVYHSLQRLLKTRMFNDTLSWLNFWGWQLIIVLAAITLLLGYTTSKEYAELEWPIDILIAGVWIIFGWNMMATIIKRRVKHIYVAIWFYIATFFTIAVLHVVNSIAIPVSFLKSYPVYAGVQDALVQWWYGHNAVAFFLTTPYLGLMYYYLPKAANRPIYSYKLSIVHFWTLLFIYIWAGPHHLLYHALPDWAQSLGVVFSVMLIAPSWGGMVNGLLTLRGIWDRVRDEPTLKFLAVAVTAYGMSTFEGPLLSLKTVNSISHFTDWTIAHVHIGGMGWNGFLTFGMLYWLVPKLFNTKLYSKSMGNVHFWLGTLGIIFYVVPLYWAAFTQTLMWKEFKPDGFLRYSIFMDTVTKIIPFYLTRIIGGLLYFSGTVLFVVNLVKTFATGNVIENEKASAPPLEKSSSVRIAGETIHGWLERRPVRFSILTIIAVLIGSIIQIVPMLAIKSNIPTIKSVKPYTPLELQGRDIYIREGCNNCHSQTVRPFRSETERYGEYSKAGEFVYDHPFLWGSRRTGPDLARTGVIGGKMYKDAFWHYEHMKSPQEMEEKSIMPPYPWLLQDDIDIESTAAKIKAMKKIGVPYEEGYADKAVDDLKKQAKKYGDKLRQRGIETEDTKEIIALIAYLHRLGYDISQISEDKSEQTIEVPEIPSDAESQNNGKQIFLTNCASCHGNFGEGSIRGPNLTDEYWLMGGSHDDIYRSVYAGNPIKGMQAWKHTLNSEELIDVTAYVISLQGTNPENAYEPQGEKYTEK